MHTARTLDQFYTRRDVAALCVAATAAHLRNLSGEWHWVEPSAGDGAFVDALPDPHVAIDIDPRRCDISAADFLAWRPSQTNQRIAVIGNPPFGKNAALARRFFDHAASFADVVAFILPRTFQKAAFVSRLHPHMHLASETLQPECAFVLDGANYSVPTVFQIWEKRAEKRAVEQRRLTHADFTFTAAHAADFAFQRVGARAGLVSVEGLQKSPQSHYFIKSHVGHRLLFNRLRMIDWEPVKRCTAGNPSIGKGELISHYAQAAA
jgi:hypothetical protein